uniref:FAS-associated factor 2 n=1 Tax=Cyanistes caeruleus TaxID=156563 RepID=A0A8C0UCK4_CYACU
MAAPEERELTAEQTEKLLQFQDLTGIESMDQCRHTLEQHNWNIEAAVQDRLNEQEGVPSVFNPPPLRQLQVNTADHRIYSYVVSRPQPRGLLGWGYYFIMLPFRFTYYTLLDIFRFAMRFIRPDPRSRVTDPVGDIISFIHMFEEKYGRIHPVFYQGTYSQGNGELVNKCIGKPVSARLDDLPSLQSWKAKLLWLFLDRLCDSVADSFSL